MLTNKEQVDTILYLRNAKYSISSISAITGISITKICEVIYEQNQEDKHVNNGYNGVF